MKKTVPFYRVAVSQCGMGILAAALLSAHPLAGTSTARENFKPGFELPYYQQVANITVSGRVEDINGEPLPGVTVSVRGSSTGTATGVDGGYQLTVPEGAVLVFSFIGFETLEVPVGTDRVIDIVLREDMASLDEVVVVGYGTQKKMTLTGSVDAISGDEIRNRPAVNMGDLMKGASPNLNITMGMRGGEPGST